MNVEKPQPSISATKSGVDEDGGTPPGSGNGTEMRSGAKLEPKSMLGGMSGAAVSGGAGGSSGMSGSGAAIRGGASAGAGSATPSAAGSGPTNVMSGMTAPDSRTFQPASRIEMGSTQISVPRLARSGLKNWMIAWDQSSGEDSRVFARLFEPARGWGEAMPLADSGASFMTLASDASGHAIALMLGPIPKTTSVSRLLCPPLLARVFSDGAWAPVQSFGYARIGAGLVAMNDVGQAVIVWMDLLDETGKSGWTQRLARFDPSSGWTDPVILQAVVASASDSQAARDNARRWPFGESLAIGPKGDAILAHSWVSDDGVTARALGRSGTGIGTRQLESTSPPRSSDTMPTHLSTTRSAIDSAGRALVVWTHTDGTHFNVRANRTVDGSSWNTSSFLETNDGGDAQDVALSMDSQGNAIAIWVQSDGLTNALWFNRFEIERGWGTAARLEPANAASNPGTPSISFDDSGKALAAWADGGKIRASRYVPGQGWTAARDLSTGTAQFTQPQVAVAKDGSGMVLWLEPVGTEDLNYWYARLE